MNTEQQALYQRIKDFPLDHAGANYRLSQRLAKENGWSREYSLRVMAEYKKFVFLAMVAGHVVSPSDQVDQVWHLHMLYTRSYWDDFCKSVLGKVLHHEPTKGGESENRKHWQLYQQTLESYQRYFETQPPMDIWPDPQQRFDRDLHFVRVNRRQFWMIPRPEFSWADRGGQTLQVLSLLTLVCFVVTGCTAQAILLPDESSHGGFFHWLIFSSLNGPEYLTLYLGVGMASLLFAVGLQCSWLKNNIPVDQADAVKLNIEQLAYLAGGQDRLVETVVVKLYEQGHLNMDEEQKLITVGNIQDLRTETEMAIHVAIINHGVNTLQELRLAVTDCDSIAADLQKLGLLADKGYQAINTRAINHKIDWLFAPLLLSGLMRLFHGLYLGYPVGLLVLWLGMTVWTIFHLQLNFSEARRTLLGDKVLQRYQTEHRQQDFSQASTTLLGDKVVLQRYKADGSVDVMHKRQSVLLTALAVTGLSVLALPAFAEIGRELGSQIGNINGGGGAGGCGGAGGNGGGASGCGSGCGGCGGCGGG
jgi:uncharacterized protein (TIGR04222 family)